MNFYSHLSRVMTKGRDFVPQIDGRRFEAIIAVCSVLFALFERPFMQRNWPQKFWALVHGKNDHLGLNCFSRGRRNFLPVQPFRIFRQQPVAIILPGIFDAPFFVGGFTHALTQFMILCHMNHCLSDVLRVASAHDESFDAIFNQRCRATFVAGENRQTRAHGFGNHSRKTLFHRGENKCRAGLQQLGEFRVG